MVIPATRHSSPLVPIEHAGSSPYRTLPRHCRGALRRAARLRPTSTSARAQAASRSTRRCPAVPGKELRNFQTDPPEITVLPAQRPAGNPADLIREAPPKNAKNDKDAKPGKSANAGNAAERMHLRLGMSEAEVLARLGSPGSDGGREGRPVAALDLHAGAGRSGDDHHAHVHERRARRYRAQGREEMRWPSRQSGRARDMRALIQRVREARVTVGGRVTGAIGPGLLVLAAVAADDTDADRDWLARKIVALRIFDDDAGVMNRSVVDVGGGDPRRQPVHALRVDEEGCATVVVRRGAARRRAAEIRCVRRRARTGTRAARSPPASSARRWKWRSSTTGR